MDQMIQSSAAMTETMLGDAEVMPGLGPVPLLQRQSASESRWTRPVPTSRESASKSFGNGCQMQPPELEGAMCAAQYHESRYSLMQHEDS